MLPVFLLLFSVSAQDSAEPVRLGPGITPPKVTVRIEPEFTEEARQASYQGAVVLEFVVSREGKPESIRVLSPLGYGLDDAAIRALNGWRFSPAEKDGQPVAVIATIEMNFKWVGSQFDEKTERRRTQHNTALQKLKRDSAKDRKEALETLEELAKAKYLPSMFAYAGMLRAGTATSASLNAAALIEAAARKKYGPALYWKALDLLEQQGDQESGLKMMRDAAFRDSPEAQLYMARLHQSGKLGVEKSDAAVRRYVRLCATRTPECQWILAQMLAQGAKRESSSHLEAIAWALLAGESVAEARAWTESEMPTLASTNQNYVQQLMRQLRR